MKKSNISILALNLECYGVLYWGCLQKHWTYWKYKAPVSDAAFLLWQEDIAN